MQTQVKMNKEAEKPENKRFPAAFAQLLPDRLYRWLEAIPGIEAAEELHLQRGGLCSLTLGGRTRVAGSMLSADEFDRLLHALLQGSLYAQETLLREGYFLYPGGYRVGISGSAVSDGDCVTAVGQVDALCLRLPRRHVGIATPLLHLLLQKGEGGIPSTGMLLFGRPGVGKTTLLRDLCEQLAGDPYFYRCAVIDDRKELFFGQTRPELHLDIYAAWPKGAGLEAAIRASAPRLLFCDELSDAEATQLLQIGGGVPLIATAHGGCLQELQQRPGLGKLLAAGRFFGAVGLHRGHGGLGFCYYDTGAVLKETV